jgi:two-component system response regulator MprA
MNILLVDDDKFLLEMYSLKFTNKGHHIFIAHNGKDGLDQIRGGLEPDVILLDMVMPELDGLEFLEAYRNEKLSPKTAIIMLTNQGQAEDIEKAEKFGIKGYLIKATTIPSEVVSEVERIVKKDTI